MKKINLLLVVSLMSVLMMTGVTAYDDQTEFTKYLDSHSEIQDFVDSLEFRIEGDISSLTSDELISLEKQALVENTEHLKIELNNVADEIPSSLLWVVSHSEVNVFMEDDYVLGIKFGKDEIMMIQGSQLENADMHLYVSDAFFEALNNGEIDLAKLTRNDAIGFKGVGFLNKMKFGAAKVAFRAFSFW
jgi:hypothetical protein